MARDKNTSIKIGSSYVGATLAPKTKIEASGAFLNIKHDGNQLVGRIAANLMSKTDIKVLSKWDATVSGCDQVTPSDRKGQNLNPLLFDGATVEEGPNGAFLNFSGMAYISLTLGGLGAAYNMAVDGGVNGMTPMAAKEKKALKRRHLELMLEAAEANVVRLVNELAEL